MENVDRDLEELAIWATLQGSAMRAEAQREANITNIKLAREARAASAREAAIAREWQELMSNTAHQREVADLIAAGLNPILTATGGSGAFVGAGAMGHSAQAQVQSVYGDNPLKDLAQSATAARRLQQLDLKLGESQVELQKSQIAKNIEEIATQRTQQQLNSAAVQRELANARLAEANIGVAGAQVQNLLETARGTSYENVKLEKEAGLYGGKAGGAMTWIEKLSKIFLPLMK